MPAQTVRRTSVVIIAFQKRKTRFWEICLTSLDGRTRTNTLLVRPSTACLGQHWADWPAECSPSGSPHCLLAMAIGWSFSVGSALLVLNFPGLILTETRAKLLLFILCLHLVPQFSHLGIHLGLRLSPTLCPNSHKRGCGLALGPKSPVLLTHWECQYPPTLFFLFPF